MRRVSRIGILQVALLAFMIALIGKAAQVQLWQGREWAEKAAKQHLERAPLLVPRGPILDATGAVLVESRNVVHLRVAPREVKNRTLLATLLTRARVDAAWVRRATDTAEKWVEIPGHYLATDVQPILGIAGVHPEMLVDRVPIASEGLRRVIGHPPNEGLESTLDSVLQGVAAQQTLLRDARGTQFEAPGAEGAPRAGDTVVLTINHALQEICERALANEVAAEGASGGDIVVVDPHDGSVLAMASSRRDPRSIEATALTEPFEPGSTIKPFIAASLLARGKATPDETIDTHNGTFEINGRTLTDEHKADRLSLRDVIRLSSNIGIAEFAERLSSGEEYETLRDLGFGMPTGVPYPAESPGTLHRPGEWSKQSPASLAIGYELAVTPLQLALAYAAIANGGELLEPGLIREIKRTDGTVLYRHARRAIRRVMPVTIADTVRAMLIETVARGTGSKADLSTFSVAGKTGTARRVEKNRGYVAGAYTATFVGLFPAANPQYVILVKINDPPAKGESYFASKAAAPVARTVLEAAIAARDASLDRGVLAHRPSQSPASPADTGIVAVSAAADVVSSATVDLPLRAVRTPPPGAPRAVPDVHGLPLRAAVHALHHAGFRVELIDGPAGLTVPAAGSMASEGAIVKLGRS